MSLCVFHIVSDTYTHDTTAVGAVYHVLAAPAVMRSVASVCLCLCLYLCMCLSVFLSSRSWSRF